VGLLAALWLVAYAATPVATPGSTQAARQFLADNHMQALMITGIAASRGKLIAQSVTATGRPRAERADMVDRVFIPTLAAHLDQLVDIVADIHARDFTADELRQFDEVAASALGETVRALTMPAKLAAAQQTTSDRLTLDATQRLAALAASPAFQKLARLTLALQRDIAAVSKVWTQQLLQDELRRRGLGNGLTA
jgi:hypothetical protein